MCPDRLGSTWYGSAYYDLADMFQEILLPRQVERRLLSVIGRGTITDYHQYMTDLFKPFPDIYWFSLESDSAEHLVYRVRLLPRRGSEK